MAERDERSSASGPQLSARPVLRRLSDAGHGGPSAADHLAPPIRADFSTSVNAYGPAPSVLAAIRDAIDIARVANYPDPSGTIARRALAMHVDLSPENVAIGAGATELILAIAQAFVRAGDRVLLPPHAFAEYERATLLSGGSVILPSEERESTTSVGVATSVLAERFVRAVSTRSPRVAFLCSPESPSGRAWPIEDVHAVADACAKADTLLVLDQSFDGFTATPLGTPALRGHPATLHLRSLTKDHALAGLRVGFVAGPSRVIAAVERARMPWMLSAPAQAVAGATCASDAVAHVSDTTARLRAAAAEIAAAARQLGFAAVASDAHYLLLDVGDARAFAGELRARHAIKVRDCSSFGLPSHIRVAARTPGDNRLLLSVLTAMTAHDSRQTH
ncbi:MAG TPA: histidinol-phosphate transaminase [Gemmatimonadaceae bacterium]